MSELMVPEWPPMSYETRCLPRVVVLRFWEKVLWLRLDGCWVWVGTRSEKEYGLFGNRDTREFFGKKLMRAHHFSWILANGHNIGDLHVLHRCDNPPCVNPTHLFLGTNRDNVEDAMKKGRRTQFGEGNGSAKLSNVQVMEIIKRLETGARISDLSAEYDISKTTVEKIKHNQQWRHIPRGAT